MATAPLVWDQTGSKTYETGIEKGVLYPIDGTTGTYPTGVAWNGLTAVTESPSGAETTKKYADNQVYLALTSAEEYESTIEAYTYPDEFKQCNGESSLATGVTIGQQGRKMFGFAYRTILGNDTDGEAHGYKLHLVYGAKAAPSEKNYQTVNDSPDAITMSWKVSATPVSVAGFNPTAQVTIDSTKADPTKLAALEKILYGSATAAARLPLPDEVKTLMAAG